MSKLAGLNRTLLDRLYTDLGKTDKEIASFFEVDRTAIVHARKDYAIKARESIGRKGELAVFKKLESLGFAVKDLNETNKLSDYDILVNENFRIDVKSSSYHKNRFIFALSEKEANECIESDNRIRLNNGRTMKVYSKTCDFLILVGFLPNGNQKYWVIPSDELPSKVQTLYISNTKSSKERYNKYLENWDFLRRDNHC